MSESSDPPQSTQVESPENHYGFDTAATSEFDAIIELAAKLCEAPASAIILSDGRCGRVQAFHGRTFDRLQLAEWFQSLTQEHGAFLEISSGEDKERLRSHLLPDGDESIRFYAGASLISPEGGSLGVLCVLDHRARQLSSLQRQALSTLAGSVTAALGQRRTQLTLDSIRRDIREAEQIGRFGRFRIDCETCKVEWSPMLYEILGVAAGEFDGRLETAYELIHPDDRIRARDAQKAVESGVAMEFEHRLVRPDGSIRWVVVRAELVRPPHGNPRYIAGTVQDITDKKESDEEAQRAATAEEGIVYVQGKIASVDLSLQDVLNLVAEEAQRLTKAIGAVVEVIGNRDVVCRAASGVAADHAASIEGFRGVISEDALRGGNILECADVRTDSRVIPSLCTRMGIRSLIAAPLFEKDKLVGTLQVLYGEPHAFGRLDVCTLQILASALSAVVERQKDSERLRQSAEQYRLLFDKNPHPMWAYDAETYHIVAVNNAAVRHYGYSEREFLQLTIRDIRPEEDWPQVEQLISGTGWQTFDCPQRWRHRKKDGSIIDVEISSDQVIFEGRPARLVLAHDVTERVRAEREVQRLSRAQHMLSSSIEALLRADDEASLLTEVCRVAVDIGGYRMAWVGYAQSDDAKTVAPVAFAGEECGYLSCIKPSWADCGAGALDPVSRTIRTGQPCMSKDLLGDFASAPWRDLALERSYRGLICLPLRDSERTIGLLCLYSATTLTIPADEVALLQRLVDNLVFGVSRLRSQQERSRMVSAVSKVAAGVSGETADEFFQNLVLNMTEALGAQAGFVATLSTDAPDHLRTIAVAVNGSAGQNFDYAIGGDPSTWLQGKEQWIFPEPCTFPAPIADLQPRTSVGRILQNAAGEAMGVLFAIFREPLRQSDFTLPTLQIFAARAAGELERQKADKRIREQASLLDKAKDAIIVRSLDGQVEFWSKGAERLFGWTEPEAVGQSVLDLLGGSSESSQNAIAYLLSHGEWTGELEKRRKDGGKVTVDANWTLVPDANGSPKSILAIETDITKRIEVEEQLLHAQRLEALGRLTGGVAHDFNNLLTVILGNAELMVDQLAENKRLRSLAEMTRTAALRCADLTHRLLAFARLQSLEPKVTDVNQLLGDMELQLRQILGEGTELRLQLAEGLWPGMLDPSQLEGVLQNLCMNSKEAMSGEGRLTIATSNAVVDTDSAGAPRGLKAGRYVMIEVTDSGTGISPENLGRVFEPFFTTKPKGKATGLGLSMAYGFVKQSRGHVEIDSQVGRGTTVRMMLPAADRMPEDSLRPLQRTRSERGSPCKILLAEDDDLVRAYAEDQLTDLGYRVIATRDGVEALDALRNHPDVDLLFTDVIMPGGLTGPQLADAARRLRPNLKVLYTSGYTDNAIVQHGIEQKTQLLNKPYRRTELARKVSAALAGQEDQEFHAE